MKVIPIYRTTTSEYQNSSFQNEEKIILESIKNDKFSLKYVTGPPKSPFIMISNSLTDMGKLDIDWKKVLLIIHPNSGYDNFNYKLVKKANFPIIIGSPLRAQAVCNYILSCLFSHFSSIPNHKNWKKDRTWDRTSILSEKNVLILGLGHIGQIIYNSLSPICKKISIFDPFKRYDNLDFENQDIIIPACNLNPTCHHILNESAFSVMPRNVLIINAARGRIIDQKAIIKFLKNNSKAFAYLDVYEHEPESFEQFKDLQNINLTSHIAGVFSGLDNKILEFEKKIISDFINNFDNPQNFRKMHSSILMNNRIRNEMLI